jgi:hypothetical protein
MDDWLLCVGADAPDTSFTAGANGLTGRNYVQLEKLGEGTYATVYKVSLLAIIWGSLRIYLARMLE